MDQEKLLSQLDKRYTSKREMLSRIPLGTQAEVVWQQLLNRRRAKSVTLPLHNSFGVPYWYCTTDKMISASERIVEMLFDTYADTDLYSEVPTLSTLEEVFFTSYVDGSKLQLREAMEFLQSDRAPQEAEEQLIANNRMAGSYAGQNLFRPVDEQYLRDLAYLLTEGMEGSSQDFRTEDTAVIPSMQDEQFSVPPARMLPDMVRELLGFLADPAIHPLIKAGVTQAWMLVVRPFPDGNERLGRILSSVILVRAGYSFFTEVSLSALIARRCYGYYEAAANILREENGGDLTYFLDYFLQLLSYAIEERERRLNQRREANLEAEIQLARAPLTPTGASDTALLVPPLTNSGSSALEQTEPRAVPEQIPLEQTSGRKGGEQSSTALQPSRIKISEEMYENMKERLNRYAASHRSILMRSAIQRLSELLDEGVYSFSMDDLRKDKTINAAINVGLLPQLCQDFLLGWNLVGEEPLYGFLFDHEPDCPAPELSEAGRYPVYDVGPYEREMMKQRLLAFAETVHGTVTPFAIKRLVEYVDQGKDEFTSLDVGRDFNLTSKQRSDLMVMLRENGLAERIAEGNSRPYRHRFCFRKPDFSRSDYAPEILARMEELSGPDSSFRDRRLADLLSDCLPKGVLTKADYFARGLTDQVWTKDKPYVIQLGLAEQISPSVLRINKKLPDGLPPLSKTLKAAVTAVYENFGVSLFSMEMFLARLAYSETHAYVCLHQLTMLRILGCRKEDQKLYQLLVNPQDNPECFMDVA